MNLVELSREQIARAQEMSHELWSGGMTLDKRIETVFAHKAQFPEYFGYFGFVDAEGEVLVSAKTYVCCLSINRELKRCLGLGAIFSKPEKRGMGLAGKLVVALLEYARRSKFDGSFLWSDIGAPYYERFGYTAFWLEKKHFAVAKVSSTAMVRPMQTEDFRFQSGLYHSAVENLQIATARSGDLWKFYRKVNPADECIVTDDSGPCGYFSCNIEGDSLWLNDCFAGPGHTEKVWEGVQNLASRKGVTKISTWYTPAGLSVIPTRTERVDKPIPMALLFNGSVPKGDGASYFFGGTDYF
jgi:GNAT superfamily N-acetyltransferase